MESRSSAALTAFLNADSDGVVTILVERDDVSGAVALYATKESTALENGSPLGSAGSAGSRTLIPVGREFFRLWRSD